MDTPQPPVVLGTPSAEYRKALLRPLAGGGQAPTLTLRKHKDGGPCWDERCPRVHAPVVAARVVDQKLVDPHTPQALILRHPTNPEAGAWGLARLAWVAAEKLWDGAVWDGCEQAEAPRWRVIRLVSGRYMFTLGCEALEHHFPDIQVGAYRWTVGHAGAAGVQLGLLTGMVEVPHAGWLTGAAEVPHAG